MMNRKKGALLVGFYPSEIGGAEYQTRLIADASKNIYDWFYISFGEKKESVENIDGYQVYNICLSNSCFNRYTLYAFLMRKVRKILDVEQPDFIYQRILNSFSPYLSSYANKKRIPFFLHIADMYCLDFSKKSLSTCIRKTMFSIVNKNNTSFITQTKEQADRLRVNEGVSGLTIPNFHPSSNKKKWKDNIYRLVWIGNVRAAKRFDLFIELSKRITDKNIEFHFIGGIENTSYGENFKSQLKGNSKIVDHGQQDNNYVNDFLLKSYLLINTSDSEGFSNTFIQAWMRGVPVVSLNSNPNGIFRNDQVGVFCDGDMDMLVSSIYDLINNTSKYEDISLKSTAISNDLFGIEKNISNLCQFMNSKL